MADALTFREYAERSGLCDQFGSPYDPKAYHTAMYSWEAAWKARPTPSPPVAAPPATPALTAKDVMEKIDTMIASVNGAHQAKREDWRQACFAAADAVYAEIAEMVAARQVQPQSQPAQPLTDGSDGVPLP